jgi:hypothetical protein
VSAPKYFGIFLLVMFIITYGLGWLFNSTTPVAGIPLFAFFSIFVVPPISIIAMIIYQIIMYKKSEDGGEPR